MIRMMTAIVLALGLVSLVLGVLIAHRMTALPPPPPVETGPHVPTHIGENAVDVPLVPAAPRPVAV